MIRAHLTYANVMATIAVFLALGGSAYAVKRIDGKDIAAHSIPAGKLKKDTLTRGEIGPRAIGRSELSHRLRAALQPPGEGEPGLPGADGFDGFPGEPGEPGPPGVSCDPTGPRLCPDDELPVGWTLKLKVGAADVAVGPAYRAGCAPACTVLVGGVLPVPSTVDAWNGPRAVQLIVESSPGTIVTQLAGSNGRPAGLVRHGDQFDLAIAVDALSQTAP